MSSEKILKSQEEPNWEGAGKEKGIQQVFQTARQLLNSRQDYFRISTGSRSLDRILGGGIEQGALTEFYGEYRTGKTQICLQLMLSVTLPKELGGMGGQAIYIDTEGNFRPERIKQMCGRYNIDSVEVLDNIFIARVNSTEKQMGLISDVIDLINDNDIKLLILDSLTANFRVDFIGETKLLERQQKLNQHLSHLHQLSTFADKDPIAVVFTNQVLGSVNVISEYETNAVGGHIIAHSSTHRVRLSRTTDFTEKYPILEATIIDSPYLPEQSAKFKITELGIDDAETEATQNFRELLAGLGGQSDKRENS